MGIELSGKTPALSRIGTLAAALPCVTQLGTLKAWTAVSTILLLCSAAAGEEPSIPVRKEPVMVLTRAQGLCELLSPDL